MSSVAWRSVMQSWTMQNIINHRHLCRATALLEYNQEPHTGCLNTQASPQLRSIPACTRCLPHRALRSLSQAGAQRQRVPHRHLHGLSLTNDVCTVESGNLRAIARGQLLIRAPSCYRARQILRNWLSAAVVQTGTLQCLHQSRRLQPVILFNGLPCRISHACWQIAACRLACCLQSHCCATVLISAFVTTVGT